MNTKIKIGEIDYAILKSLSYGTKTIQNLNKILRIRTIVIERHIYILITKGFVYFQFELFAINQEGENAIISFEKDNPLEIWKPIDQFIISTMSKEKEQKIKSYKIADYISLIFMIILVALIIYFGKDLLVND